MAGWRPVLTGMGTGIAMRTLALFCTCAVVPIVATYLLADRTVSRQFTENARQDLQSASKAYGLMVFERLMDADRLLGELASIGLRRRLSADEISDFSSGRLRIVDVTFAAAGDDQDVGGGRTSRIELRRDSESPQIVIHHAGHAAGGVVRIAAVLQDEYLWNTEPAQLSGLRVCVRAEDGTPLYCSGEAADGAELTGGWELFLRPQFGAMSWHITAEAAAATALADLTAFRSRLPLLTMIAIALAVLLSAVQIRRSHKPLAMLMAASQNLGRRGRRHVVRIVGTDEYARLARAFNRMSAGLARQFSVLREQARIDRMILEEPAIDAVVQSMLAVLPRLLGAHAVAVAIEEGGGPGVRLHWAGRPGKEVKQAKVLLAAGIAALMGTHRMMRLDDAPADAGRLKRLMTADNAVALPIGARGQVRGALIVAGRGGRLRPWQVRHARAFARRIAVALGAQERRDALLRQAYYDELTGLPNRQLFKERCSHEIAHARREGGSIAVAYVDLDRFKIINDTLGHAVGDELLQEVARRLKAGLRDGDTLARLGGDEFALIVSNADAVRPHVAAELMLDALREPMRVGGAPCFVTASIGMAVYPGDGDTVELLLRNADTAMYRGKAAGGGVAVYFEEQMNRELQRRHEVEQRLRVAIDSGAIGVAYQPQMSLADGSIRGVEALARWHDAELGAVPPTVFVPVAEECGMIGELGAAILRRACEDFRRWRDQGFDTGRISVNASLGQLRDPGYAGRVMGTLLEAGVRPDCLEIEVTESMLAHSPRAVAGILQQLRDAGVRIAIDDFGTGYSSMAALGQLPVDVLKIDRSFVTNCADDPAAAAVVGAIISMAHALGKKVIAEGIETPAQLETLRRLDCDAVQGYLFTVPIGADAVPSMLGRRGTVADPQPSQPHCRPALRSLSQPISGSK